MYEAEMEKHAEFLKTLGVGDQDIEAVMKFMEPKTPGYDYFWDKTAIPLLPPSSLQKILEAKEVQILHRPGIYGLDNKAALHERAEYYRLVATLMDIRAHHGEAGATEASNAIRRHMKFLCERAAQLDEPQESAS